MKASSLTVKRIVVAFTVAAPMLAGVGGLYSGCVTPQTMSSASNAPASQGTVEATLGSNGNTNLSIHVKHLAPPSRMASDATVYVVWIAPRDGDAQNVGMLTLDDNLEGSLQTITPHRRFHLTVTPEPSGRVAHPSHEPVFTTDVEQGD